ncbi:beta-galactosidase [Clonorchis sinensis]|uniref:Beta-galactosidase n=1 Tax=Clonorchis sinensis TaxID=79923 RepID=H2KPQ1_CLOSI|nr:beta-galactosidase [Clonorchis sinensis]
MCSVLQHAFLFLCICVADSLVAPAIQFDIRGARVQENRSFTIDPDTHTFLKDGAQFQYIAGSFHYFRIPTLYWRDRLEKAKAAGLDAIQLYIPWNFHEPEEGEYNFADDRDLEYFIDIIQQLDMLAIVRAGPYICAEWAFGGLPPWLLRKNPYMKIRSSDPAYYQEVVNWFNVLLPKLRKHLYTEGGPIIMVQMENEYGSYGLCDRTYMTNLYDLARSHLGQDVILFTTDGCALSYLRCGVLDPRYLATIDFGPTTMPPDLSFSSVEQFRPGQPLVNSEFYSGWFDGWGGKHARTGAEFLRNSLMNLMNYSKRVNVNMYMFHGGTNFGLWNGKPHNIPAITSYDYDAPISEAGDVTYKYELLQKAIFEFRNQTPPPLPKNTTKKAYGSIQLYRTSHLLLGFGVRTLSRYPLNMESLHQYEGFTIYYVSIPGAPTDVELTLENYRDLAHVFTADDQLASVHWRGCLYWPENSVKFDLRDSQAQTHLVLLLENTGYFNYGCGMYNNIKGLLGNVTLNGQILTDWAMIPLKSPLETNEIDFPQVLENLPEQGSVYDGELLIQEADQPEDTFIEPGGFSRGIITVNSHVIGRFDQKLGPQKRLFIPKQYLHQGQNRITVCELRTILESPPNVTFFDQMEWSGGTDVQYDDYQRSLDPYHIS